MDYEGAPQSDDDVSPIFEGFRRGYNPDQVDRFVADQQRRLDETLNRATEAERRLAAAVGQLRELHRRVAVLEEKGHPQETSLDVVGERIQRILQEAWEGANAIRQKAEDEASEVRQRTLREAEQVVGAAREKAKTIETDIEHKRRAYLGRVEEERSRAVAQITFLHEQRKTAVGELVRIKDAINSTVGKVTVLHTNAPNDKGAAVQTEASPEPPTQVPSASDRAERAEFERSHSTVPRREEPQRPMRPRTVRDIAPKTMPVVHLGTNDPGLDGPDASELVRNHRAAVEGDPRSRATIRSIDRARKDHATATVFDFEEE